MSCFRALVVDDEELYAHAIVRALERASIPADLAFTGGEALALAEGGSYELILLDHRLPDGSGLELIPELLSHQPRAALLMMTAYEAIPDAVLAIRRGAEDYLVKQTSVDPILERAVEVRDRHAVLGAAAAPRGPGDPPRRGERGRALIGRAPAILRAVEELDKLARSPETTVLITGETGVGKEVAARQLHDATHPGGAPLVAVDTLSIPDSLAESFLFGHEKGAFTGADRSRAGAFEEAGEGTIFLDEIGDIEGLQGKLLRVLESRAFARVGSLDPIPLRARVVAATNRDLRAMVEEGAFRRDLFERLSVFPIHIPPLRERLGDVAPLAETFLAGFAEKLGRDLEPLGADVLERLSAYDYPGNVRELKNVIERAVIVADGARIEAKHLPHRVLSGGGAGARGAGTIPLRFVPGVDNLEQVEKRMIQQAMKRAGNVKARAARLLGISRYQLLRRMDKYSLS